MTEKLYYLDSHLAEFDALVLSCEAAEGGFDVVLDRTAFFPEGGGQRADTGFLADARVSDVQERGGLILHRTDAPLEAGAQVHGKLDFEQRLRRMQNHSGEHIVSGLVHASFGWDNVGFHMGEACMTIDFNGELSWEELMQIEQRANEVVRADLPVRAWLPKEDALKTMDYRSKLELTENVRIVEIEGVDRCACCAPHVAHTGEIGVVKILDSERHRGGVRVSVICGMDALEDYRARQESVTEVSRLLSAKRGEIAAAVQRVLAEQEAARAKSDALSGEVVRLMAESAGESAGNLCLFSGILDEIAQRELVNLLMEHCGGLAGVFCGSDETGWRYIIGSLHVDLRANTRAVNAAVDGRGGGKPRMIQGRAAAKKDAIRAAFDTLLI